MRTANALSAVILSALLVSGASAAVFEVDAAGSTSYLTIQSGVSAASDGDTVLIHGGTYSGAGNTAVDPGARNLTIQSLDARRDAVTIDCGSAARAFLIQGGQDTTLVVRDVTITNGSVGDIGGAVYVKQSGAKFENVAFTNNTATMWGGAARVDNGATAIFVGCTFEANTTGGSGGAVHVTGIGSSAGLRDCQILDNQAASWGGGVVSYSSAVVTMRGCRLENNEAVDGGGAYCRLSAELHAVGCQFVGNTAQLAGGAYVREGQLTLMDCRFEDNEADTQGGGVRFYMAPDSWAMYSVFQGNSCGYRGGAIECNQCDPGITNCTLVGNSATDRAAGLFLYDADPVVQNTVISYSAAGEAVLCDGGFENPTFTHCLIYQNAGGDSLCGTHTDNLFGEPPLFCDKDAGNLALCEDSSCLASQNGWGELVGALGQGCGPCGQPVKPASWGTIKDLFR
jgi:predicted outer membrane repeat protein